MTHLENARLLNSQPPGRWSIMLLLIVILAYAVSIPFSVWCATADCGEPKRVSYLEVAAKRMPRSGWLFWLAGQIHDLVTSPIVLGVVVVGLPFILARHYSEKFSRGRSRYSDPLFMSISKHVLTNAQRKRFRQFEEQFEGLGFVSLGVFKYKPEGLNELVEYFHSPDRKNMAAVYCLYDQYQVFLGTVFQNGTVVGTSGLEPDHFKQVLKPEKNAAGFRRKYGSGLEPSETLTQHKQLVSEWGLTNGTVATIDLNCWQKAFVLFERMGNKSSDQPLPWPKVELSELKVADVIANTAESAVAPEMHDLALDAIHVENSILT